MDVKNNNQSPDVIHEDFASHRKKAFWLLLITNIYVYNSLLMLTAMTDVVFSAYKDTTAEYGAGKPVSVPSYYI